MCWLFCGATETESNVEGWHGEENHTNNTGELKAMLAAHVFIQHLQSIAGKKHGMKLQFNGHVMHNT